jgi:GNAT superfamily N-acetyltransferase
MSSDRERFLDKDGYLPSYAQTRAEFLGDPKIVGMKEARDLKPAFFRSLQEADDRPFMEGLAIRHRGGRMPCGSVLAEKNGEKIPVASYIDGTLVVDKKFRQRGIAFLLVKTMRETYPYMKIAQTRNKHSQALQIKVHEAIVREAAERGLEIPEIVLKDYPSIQARPALQEVVSMPVIEEASRPTLDEDSLTKRI